MLCPAFPPFKPHLAHCIACRHLRFPHSRFLSKQEGIATYEAAIQLDPDNKDLWLNLGMACKEGCWVERAEQVTAAGGAVGWRGAARGALPKCRPHLAGCAVSFVRR